MLPPSFRLPFSGGLDPYAPLQREPEIYQALAIAPVQLRPLGNFNYSAIARLAPGATIERALAEINAVQAQFPRQAGENVVLEARILPFSDLLFGRVRTPLWTMMAAVGAVLLIMCVNLVNLLIARMTARRHESAIRTALGATSRRQLRQMLTESLLLALCGGLLGTGLAVFGVSALVRTAAADLPRLDQVRLDAGVVAFAVGLSLLTGLLSGLLPAWLLRKAPQDALKSGAHTMTGSGVALRARHALLACEIAVSAALLIVAGLLAVSFVRLTQVDKGFDADRVLAVDLSLVHTKFVDEPERERFFERLLANLRSAPGTAPPGSSPGFRFAARRGSIRSGSRATRDRPSNVPCRTIVWSVLSTSAPWESPSSAAVNSKRRIAASRTRSSRKSSQRASGRVRTRSVGGFSTVTDRRRSSSVSSPTCVRR